jgi:lipoate-protein ligase A
MSLDLALADSVRQGASGPVLRFYDWQRPTVSLGYNQKAGEVDLEYCRLHGIDVVRRPTGGRAVFHNAEFTYSVIAPEDEPLLSGGVLEAYRSIGRALLEGLRVLGISAQMQRSETRGQSVRGSALCFAAAGRYEITVQGRKLLGSAQRRMEGVILQQGSLLLSQPQTPEMFRNKNDQASAVTVRELTGRQPDFEQAARAMEQGFRTAWGVDIQSSEVRPEEEKAAGDKIPAVKIT